MLCFGAEQERLRLFACDAVLFQSVLPLEQLDRIFGRIAEVIGRLLDLQISKLHQPRLQIRDFFAFVVLFQGSVRRRRRVLARSVRIGNDRIRFARVLFPRRILRILFRRSLRYRRPQKRGQLRNRFRRVLRFSGAGARGDPDDQSNNDQQQSNAEQQYRQRRAFLRHAETAPVMNDVGNCQLLLFHTESVSLF